MILFYLLIGLASFVRSDFVDIACERNPGLPYCKSLDVRRKEPTEPEDPFEDKFEPREEVPTMGLTSAQSKIGRKSGEDDISLEIEEATTIRPRRSTTSVPPQRQNILYTIFPTLQLEKDWRKYCPVNQYTFQVTCLPGKKLRYDLQVFCQEFSENCGVPNINLYPSRHEDQSDVGRPKGYGQKQKNGQLGLGRSFGFGLGAIPVLNKLGGNRPNKRVRGYEPGYGAVNPNAPLAIGKVDRDAINLPGGFGDIEIEKGGGFGFGK
ncbi:hypothetical protein NECAME_11746 [Necator americanus]|uniref:Uncharacterized protein n=1 Tax=Necator americanus TaxID=51031 RepID=W2T480_NECAM|nr:hypothetical protein NECAME_11746 [Necator americanus]ETN76364.1 hypothetical protein NECAME_11746 [Necator americanus]